MCIACTVIRHFCKISPQIVQNSKIIIFRFELSFLITRKSHKKMSVLRRNKNKTLPSHFLALLNNSKHKKEI